MKFTSLGSLAAVILCGTLLTGCLGFYRNNTQFVIPPKEGITELSMLQTYGRPSYSGFVENQKVYIYSVRENQYIVLIGIYKGYDLVVTCEGGVVRDVKRVNRPEVFTLLNPVPWAVSD